MAKVNIFNENGELISGEEYEEDSYPIFTCNDSYCLGNCGYCR